MLLRQDEEQENELSKEKHIEELIN